MEIKYTYFKTTSYDIDRGEEFGDSEDFVYELTDDQIIDGLCFISTNKSQSKDFRDGFKYLIEKLYDDGMLYEVAKNYYEELKEYYEDDAKDWFLENKK